MKEEVKWKCNECGYVGCPGTFFVEEIGWDTICICPVCEKEIEEEYIYFDVEEEDDLLAI